MADYHPLIARAVAGLEKNNGENRRALYERARGALLAQLRSVTPALNESDITRERLALEGRSAKWGPRLPGSLRGAKGSRHRPGIGRIDSRPRRKGKTGP